MKNQSSSDLNALMRDENVDARSRMGGFVAAIAFTPFILLVWAALLS